MGKYKIEFKKSALKELYSLPKSIVGSILKVLEQISIDPKSGQVKKLSGESLYRIRVRGKYRIIYEINDDIVVVIVVRIANRSKVYRKLN